ncbi:MAG: recombination mediator RecR [bacterium]
MSIRALDDLTAEFKKMPGIGLKTAQRLSFYVLRISKQEADKLARAICQVKEKVRYCSICGNITEQEPCEICSNPKRDSQTICIVEEPKDLLIIEKTGEYRGLYHVLMGAISPLDGIGPEDLKIENLMQRIKSTVVKEVILATNPNVEGEATATYLSRLIKPFGIRVYRIARGLPVGSELEYADEVTVTKALEGKMEM